MLKTFVASYLGRKQLSIFRYHRVMPGPDPMRPDEIDKTVFSWQMALLRRYFHVLPLSEAVERLKKNALPARAVSITFDDGYADNEEVALPILKENGLCATFFVITGAFDGTPMWNDCVREVVRQCQGDTMDLSRFDLGVHDINGWDARQRALNTLLQNLKYVAFSERLDKVRQLVADTGTRLPRLMMNREQVQRLRHAGMEIGGHTVNHPILESEDDATAEREIREGKETLEGILNETISLFAYPNGMPGQDYSARHAAMVKKLGFKAAVSTSWGACLAHMDPYQLPRMVPAVKSKLHFVGRVMENARVTPQFAAGAS